MCSRGEFPHSIKRDKSPPLASHRKPSCATLNDEKASEGRNLPKKPITGTNLRLAQNHITRLVKSELGRQTSSLVSGSRLPTRGEKGGQIKEPLQRTVSGQCCKPGGDPKAPQDGAERGEMVKDVPSKTQQISTAVGRRPRIISYLPWREEKTTWRTVPLVMQKRKKSEQRTICEP